MQISAFQQLMKQIAPSAKNLPFHSGDLVKGTIQKLFLNQLALVNIHNVTVLAKLEAPLEAFQSYWFEVQPKNGDKPYLKLLQPQTASQGSQDLFTLTGMSSSKTNRALVDFFLEQKLPIPKNIGDVSAWIKGDGPTPLDKQVLQLISQRELPFTKTVFTSLTAALQDTSISAEANQLAAILAKGANVKGEPIQQLIHLLSTIVQPAKGAPLSPTAEAIVPREEASAESLRGLSRLVLDDVKRSGTAPSPLLVNWLANDKVGSYKEPLAAILSTMNLEELTELARPFLRDLKENTVSTVKGLVDQLATLKANEQKAFFTALLGSNKLEVAKSLTGLFLQDVKEANVLSPSMIFDWTESLQGDEEKTFLLRLLNAPRVADHPQSVSLLQTLVERKDNDLPVRTDLQKDVSPKSNIAPQQDDGIKTTTSPLQDVGAKNSIAIQKGMEIKDNMGSQRTMENTALQNDAETKRNITGHPQRLGELTKPQVIQQLTELLSKQQITTKEVIQTLLMIDKTKVDSTIPTHSQPNAQDIVKNLKAIVQSLGMSHEHDVKNVLNMSSSPHQAEELQTLKALLMKSEALIPPQGKEVAETLLQKITGFQLLSQDNGPVTSLYMQIPLPLGQSTKDVTIQWSGKKTKNDQIDPAYCHILFYLRLDHLEDTVVDVRVQNRVVTIGVINDHPAIGALIGVKKPELQEALAQLNYRLTEVKTVSSHGSAKKQGTLFPSASSSQSYTGVDFRI